MADGTGLQFTVTVGEFLSSGSWLNSGALNDSRGKYKAYTGSPLPGSLRLMFMRD